MNLPLLRILNQQLTKPQFNSAHDVVQWMGGMQAQNIKQAKWAIGMRMKSPSLNAVEKSLAKGEILRTHVLRTTWHFVTAEDIRWMLQLNLQKQIAIYNSYAKMLNADISEAQYSKSNALLQKILVGNNLTTEEIAAHYSQNGFPDNEQCVKRLINRAELEGVICSGISKGSKQTYALLDERVPITKKLTKEESLVCLAERYFCSHAPATLADFTWWSGLTISEAKQAVCLIDSNLIEEKYQDKTFYIHNKCRTGGSITKNVCLLPSFDEYLIAYNDRTQVLEKEFYNKAFTRNGIFFPIVALGGKIVGNWKGKSKSLVYEWFYDKIIPDETLLKNNEFKYFEYLNS